jgi:hypothetical protein
LKESNVKIQPPPPAISWISFLRSNSTVLTIQIFFEGVIVKLLGQPPMSPNQRCGAGAGTTTTVVSPPVLPCSPLAPSAPVIPGEPVAPVSPFWAGVPATPCGPAGPAGPGTGTATMVAEAEGGVTTTVGLSLSHALNASVNSTAATTIEYLMMISYISKKN